jgi:hypothetical protein
MLRAALFPVAVLEEEFSQNKFVSILQQYGSQNSSYREVAEVFPRLGVEQLVIVHTGTGTYTPYRTYKYVHNRRGPTPQNFKSVG